MSGGLTAQQQASEQVVVPGRGVAVPAVAAELMLALGDPVLHPGPDDLHHSGVLAAQLALLVHQPRDVVTHDLGAQGAHVPAERRRQTEREHLRKAVCKMCQCSFARTAEGWTGT